MTIFKTTQKPKTTKNVSEIPITEIKLNPHRTRRYLDKQSLCSLAKSIGQVGMLQPVLVRRTADGEYQLISGERRLRAARLAGLKEIPCIVLGISERRSALFALAENIQRSQIDMFEEAESLSELIKFYGMTKEDAAIKLGISLAEIKDKLGLLGLSEEERRLSAQLKLDYSQTVLLSKVKREFRLEALERYAQGVLTAEDFSNIEKILDNEEKERILRQKNSAVLGNKSLFFHTVDKAVEILNGAGGCAVVEKIKAKGQTMIMITVQDS